MRFISKVFLLLLGVVVTVVGLTNVIFHVTAQQVVLSGMGEEALRIARLAATEISEDAERLQPYLTLHADPRPSIEHKNLLDNTLADIRNRYAEFGVENVYSIMLIGDELKVAGDPSVGSPPPLTVTDTANVAFKKNVFASGRAQAMEESYSDNYGVWMSAYAPIRSPDGEVLALLGIDLPLGAFTVMDELIKRNLFLSVLPALIIAGLASFLASRRLTRPLLKLNQGLREVQAGDFGRRLDIQSADEFGSVAEAFNAMVDGLAEKQKIQSALHQAVSPQIAKKMLAEEIAPRGEIVEGTVLFADVRGFTALSETISAAETISFVNTFLDVAVPCIMEQGGVIEKFVGDEIFAVFGVPEAMPGESVNAVAAAIQIRDRLKYANADRRTRNMPPIEVGIGITTGVMVAGMVGVQERKNYTLLGATVNEGARICSAARPGEILVSQSTYLRIKKKFEVEELPPLQAKGKTFALKIFRIIR